MWRGVCEYVLLFFFCSVLGWMMETTCKLIEYRRFINRGFLIGPYCPIYGCGAVLITWLLSDYADSPLVVFVLAVALCGTLEYLTSYIMEKLFHARWWDYSARAFNLNGRICAGTLIPFGLLGLLLIYLIDPLLSMLWGMLSTTAIYWLCGALTAIFIADICISTNVLNRICKTTELTGGDDTETLTRKVGEALASRNFLARRTLRAFPGAKLYNRQLRLKLKQARIEMKQNLADAQRRLRSEIDAREKQVRDAIEAHKNESRK